MNTIKLSSGKNITYKVLDSRTIEIHSLVVKKVCNDEGNIVKLAVGNLEINVGDLIDIDVSTIPSKYKISFIKSNSRNLAYLFTHERNKCTEYLLPCLSHSRNKFYYDSYLINAYLDKEMTTLWLRYRFSTHEEYKKLEAFLTSHTHFIETKDINYDFVDYKFHIDSAFDDDVLKFLDGKYSQFSIQLKINIGKFHDLKPRSRLLQILNKDNNLKNELEKTLGISIGDLDLDDKPDIYQEII